MTDAKYNTTDFHVDGDGRDAGRTLADQDNLTGKSYSAEGWLKTKSDGNGNNLEYIYNGIGELTSLKVEGVAVREVPESFRDGIGRITEVNEKNGAGTSDDVTTNYSYVGLESNRLHMETTTVTTTVGSRAFTVTYFFMTAMAV